MRSAAAINGCRVLTRRGSPLPSLRRITTIRCGAGCTLFAYVISLLSGAVSGFDKRNVEREQLALKHSGNCGVSTVRAEQHNSTSSFGPEYS